MTVTDITTFDPAVFERLLGTAVTDAGATMAAGLVVIGSRLGLYAALADGPLTTAVLAARTASSERYVREWARAQAAGGYLSYDPESDRYGTSSEQALAFDPNGPVNLAAMFNLSVHVVAGWQRLEEAFRTGRGIGYHEQTEGVTCGVTEFYRAGYVTNLLDYWIPALPGVPEALTAGARVADIGCGHGITTILMAQRYPAATFHGYDYDADSIERARAAAAEAAGIGDRVSFEVCDAADIPALGYDLVATFDALHDYGHPDIAARRVRESLAPGGSWMIVEPRAGDAVTDNLHPVGRMFYSGSHLHVRAQRRLAGRHGAGRAGGRARTARGTRRRRFQRRPSRRRHTVQHRAARPHLTGRSDLTPRAGSLTRPAAVWFPLCLAESSPGHGTGSRSGAGLWCLDRGRKPCLLGR